MITRIGAPGWCIAAAMLLVVAPGDAMAQCQMTLVDVTGPANAITSPYPVSNGGRYRLTASGSGANHYDIFLFVRRPGIPTPLGVCSETIHSPTEREIEVCCLPDGPYEVFGAVRCDGDLSTEVSQTLPIQITHSDPSVTITATKLYEGRYRINPLFTTPVWAATPDNVQTAHSKRLADGSYAPPSIRWWSPSLDLIEFFAQPGDRIALSYTTCERMAPRNVGAQLTIADPEPPLSVDVAVLQGDGQRAVVRNAPEAPLTVKFTASQPSFDLTKLEARFDVVSAPPNASGYGLDATDPGRTLLSYTVPVAADGTASAVLTTGDREGPYVVRVASPLSLTGSDARFTITAVEPESVAILKDTPDLTDRAPSYAVAATQPTPFHALGLDAAGQKIGPMKCEWSLTANGNPSTRGAGTIAPGPSRSTTFRPTNVGKATISADPPMSGVRTASADLFVTQLYVSVGAFDPANPVDQLDLFVPGSLPDGTSVAITQMPQRVTLHVLTGGSSRGFVTFELEEVSAYPGMAMNWPISNPQTTTDLAFDVNGTPQSVVRVPFSGSGDTTATLLVRDYGARGRLRVTVESGRTMYALSTRRLPKDANANGIPDSGWEALANSATGAMNHVDDVPSPSVDDDHDPIASGLPALGKVGDGLTALEEYRGFVVRGRHRRLHASRKDVFVMIDPADDWLDDRIIELPLTIHKIRLAEGSAQLAPVINPNRSGIPGATLQRGIRARNRPIPPDVRRLDGSIVRADFQFLGYTFPLGTTLDLIDEGDAILSDVGSPNETFVSEVFDSAFWQHYISYGPDGIRDTHVAPTDTDDPAHAVIHGYDPANPSGPPTPLDWLQSSPNSANRLGDDFNTQTMFTVCGTAPNPPWRALTATELLELYRNVFLHEIAHAVDVEHDLLSCTQSIMGVEDAVPITRQLTASDRNQIRVHRKH